jgi:ureidoglycolate hydrolase
MAPEIVKIKVQTLNEDAFKPYGSVLKQKRPIFPEVDPGEGKVAMELLRAKPGSGNQQGSGYRIEELAIHYSYNQAFIPLKGSMILIVAPAPPKIGKSETDYPVDYSKLAAFVVEPGQAAMIGKGVWHGSAVPGAECEFINVTRKNPGEVTSDQFRHPTQRGYVEMVDVLKRDNKVIEVEL